MTEPRLTKIALTAATLCIAAGTIGIIAGSSAPSQAEVTSLGSRDLHYLNTLNTPTAIPQPAATGQAPSLTPAAADGPISPMPADPPARIRIPAIDVNTTVEPVGMNNDGSLTIPSDITKTGWDELSIPPGSAEGSTVIVAHRDGKNGHGVFYTIGNLTPGDTVTLETQAGKTLTYKVVSRELIPLDKYKSAAPELFSTTGPHRLTLISCGGLYDKARGGYQANIVVTGVPET